MNESPPPQKKAFMWAGIVMTIGDERVSSFTEMLFRVYLIRLLPQSVELI